MRTMDKGDDFARLNPGRKADRFKAALRLREVAHKHGFHIETEGTGTDMLVRLSHPCGACASIWIDRTSKDHELVAWYTAVDSDWRYPPDFGEVNPYHGRKASHVYPWAILDAAINRHCRKIAQWAAS